MQDLTISDLIGIFLKRWWLFAISAIVCGAMFFTYTLFFITPLYSSSGMLYINNRAISNQNTINGANINDLYVAERLVENYKIILKTAKFLNSVIEDTGLKLTVEQLSGMLSVSSVEETEVLKITIVAADPALAHTLAVSVLNNAQQKLSDILEVGYVRIIEDSSFSETPVSPNVRKNGLIGIMLGLVIAAGISLFIELMDLSIKTEDDIEKYFDIPLVGSIPDLDEVVDSNSGGYYASRSSKTDNSDQKTTNE